MCRWGVDLVGNMSIRVEIEDGRRKAKVESCGLRDQVAWEKIGRASCRERV